ncbi:hypothetical protein BD769DRAFT_1426647, partial [Suillus cothurnatus]
SPPNAWINLKNFIVLYPYFLSLFRSTIRDLFCETQGYYMVSLFYLVMCQGFGSKGCIRYK